MANEIIELTSEYLAGRLIPHEYRNLLIVELMNLELSRRRCEESKDDVRLSLIAVALLQGSNQ